MPEKANKSIRSATVTTAVRALGFYDKDAQNPDYMAISFLSRKFKIIVWILRIVQKLVELYGSLPKHVTYIPLDFNSQSIKDVMLESGYKPDKRTFFIWEGVSYYLPNNSFDAVLEFVANNSASTSLITFDYAIRSFIEGDYSTYGSKKLADTWEKMGEPGLSGIRDGSTDRFLNERGLSIISDLGPEELEQIHATNEGGRVPGHIWGCMRIVYATVIR